MSPILAMVSYRKFHHTIEHLQIKLIYSTSRTVIPQSPEVHVSNVRYPDQMGILKCRFFVEGGKSEQLEKNLQSKVRTKHKLNPCCRMFLGCSNVFHSVNPSCGNKCGRRFLSSVPDVFPLQKDMPDTLRGSTRYLTGKWLMCQGEIS